MQNLPYRALIVDDERNVRDVVREALSRVGFACDLASNGEEALERVASADYEIVVTDLRMPHKHGHALAPLRLARDHRGPEPRRHAAAHGADG